MFHVEVIAFQPTFYDIGNTCTEDEAGVTPITAEVTGGDTDPGKMKENTTACQVETSPQTSKSRLKYPGC